MNFEESIKEVGVDEKVLKQAYYVHEGTVGGDLKDWEELEDHEKLAWLYVFQYFKDTNPVEIEDHDQNLVKQIKESMNNNHGYMAMVFMNPGGKPKFSHAGFRDAVDPTEFSYLWENFGKQFGEQIFGEVVPDTLNKFERRNLEDVNIDGFTKIEWSKLNTHKTLPEFTKDEDAKEYYTDYVLGIDQYGNAEVGKFAKKGKKSKRVKWITESKMDKPQFYCDPFTLVKEYVKDKK